MSEADDPDLRVSWKYKGGPGTPVPPLASTRVLLLVVVGEPNPLPGGQRAVRAKLYDRTPEELTNHQTPEPPIADLQTEKTIGGCVHDLARDLHSYLTNELGSAQDHHLRSSRTARRARRPTD